MTMWSDAELDEFPWDRVSHAYGNSSQIPQFLRGLLATDAKSREHALLGLSGAMHNGVLETAAGPVVAFLARMLPDHRLAAPAPGGGSMRKRVLTFLAHAAANASYYEANPDEVIAVRRDDVELDAFEVMGEFPDDPDHVAVGRLGAGCARRSDVVLPLLVPELDGAEHAAALYATACWAGLTGRAASIPDPALRRLWEVARDVTGDEASRIDCVLGLAGAGADTAEFFDDPSMAVRACAALSPAVSDDQRTRAVIMAALNDGAEWRQMIGERSPRPFIGAGDLSERLTEGGALRFTS
ncbi:hypothetical protein ACQPZJ_18960 [Actinoplanes sp. CA-054009]